MITGAAVGIGRALAASYAEAGVRTVVGTFPATRTIRGRPRRRWPTRAASALLKNPAVEDVALVDYPDDQGGELACAVLVAAPSRRSDQGMTDYYVPTRVEYVERAAAQRRRRGAQEAALALASGESSLTSQ